MNDLTLIIMVFITIVLSIVIGIWASRSDDKEQDKHGDNNRSVRSIIYAYQIISNSSLGYKDLVEIFDKSQCFAQLRAGNELFLTKGFQYNLITICGELRECDEINESFKESLKSIDEEKLRIVFQANKIDKLY